MDEATHNWVLRFNKKAEVLNKMARDTKELISRLKECENGLEIAFEADKDYRNQKSGYLASIGSDCAIVKRMLAELKMRAPETTELLDEDGSTTGKRTKKLTKPDKESWLILQRTRNPELAEAVETQQQVSFQLEANRVALEMTKKRLEGIKAVLAFKTAQLNFLAS